MTNGEPLASRLIARRLAQLLDIRPRRAAAHPLDHRFDRPLLARNQRLDAAVRAVPHPAADAQRDSLFPGPGAEEDALHTTRNADRFCDPRHVQTVAMSGASSAFIPTTL